MVRIISVIHLSILCIGAIASGVKNFSDVFLEFDFLCA